MAQFNTIRGINSIKLMPQPALAPEPRGLQGLEDALIGAMVAGARGSDGKFLKIDTAFSFARPPRKAAALAEAARIAGAKEARRDAETKRLREDVERMTAARRAQEDRETRRGILAMADLFPGLVDLAREAKVMGDDARKAKERATATTREAKAAQAGWDRTKRKALAGFQPMNDRAKAAIRKAEKAAESLKTESGHLERVQRQATVAQEQAARAEDRARRIQTRLDERLDRETAKLRKEDARLFLVVTSDGERRWVKDSI